MILLVSSGRFTSKVFQVLAAKQGSHLGNAIKKMCGQLPVARVRRLANAVIPHLVDASIGTFAAGTEDFPLIANTLLESWHSQFGEKLSFAHSFHVEPNAATRQTLFGTGAELLLGQMRHVLGTDLVESVDEKTAKAVRVPNVKILNASLSGLRAILDDSRDYMSLKMVIRGAQPRFLLVGIGNAGGKLDNDEKAQALDKFGMALRNEGYE